MAIANAMYAIHLQVLANIETAQRQNRLFDALKQGNAALKSLQQVWPLDPISSPCCHSECSCPFGPGFLLTKPQYGGLDAIL